MRECDTFRSCVTLSSFVALSKLFTLCSTDPVTVLPASQLAVFTHCRLLLWMPTLDFACFALDRSEVKFVVASGSKLPALLKALPGLEGELVAVVYWGAASDSAIQVGCFFGWQSLQHLSVDCATQQRCCAYLRQQCYLLLQTRRSQAEAG
jgi:hypothetical protein